jgi:sirohydrochlorin cobaltochelatase
MEKMMSHRIILLAHGSSDKHWCQTFENLAMPTLDAVAGSRIAYMELAQPSLEEVVAEGIREGQTAFTVLPLFLAAGRHLRKDVPAKIAKLEEAYGVSIHLTPPVGESALLGQAIRDIVTHELRNPGLEA